MIKRISNEYQPKIIERALKKKPNSWFQAVKKRLTSFQEFGVCFRQATEGFTFNKLSTTATSILDRKKNYHLGSTTRGHPEE
ncbi:hypothetical protein TSAR_016675 [Trichomalopsis sarcophagae]|uniref:Uncharacterized protein n=1 Tax=Trichomalopsis sarcophagae TaxID=543379 RepID=A0A232EDM5_9HYME|nr:hypothetical protein TSAR_016675 [Trichomalopsis sarcophagae]